VEGGVGGGGGGGGAAPPPRGEMKCKYVVVGVDARAVRSYII